MPAPPPASACPLRDQRPPEGQPSPTEEAQRGKRPRPQQVPRGTRLPCWSLLGGPETVVSTVHTPGQMGRARGSQRTQRPRLPEGRKGPRTGDPRVTLRCGPAQENAGSQAQTRPRPSAKASILAEAKGSVSASDQRPPSPQGSCQLSAPSISLKEAASVVVKCLTPFYKEGKFASKVW